MSLKSARFFITHSAIDSVRLSSSSCRTGANRSGGGAHFPDHDTRRTGRRSHHQSRSSKMHSSEPLCMLCGVWRGERTNSTWTREGVRRNNALSCDCKLCIWALFACNRRRVQLAMHQLHHSIHVAYVCYKSATIAPSVNLWVRLECGSTWALTIRFYLVKS